jgi:hypothetical protein
LSLHRRQPGLPLRGPTTPGSWPRPTRIRRCFALIEDAARSGHLVGLKPHLPVFEADPRRLRAWRRDRRKIIEERRRRGRCTGVSRTRRCAKPSGGCWCSGTADAGGRRALYLARPPVAWQPLRSKYAGPVSCLSPRRTGHLTGPIWDCRLP